MEIATVRASSVERMLARIEKRRMEKMMKRDHVSLDVPKLVESVRADLGALPSFSSSCCIYKVPEEFLELNINAYTPRMISIGPIHHLAKEKLLAMEKHKKIYLREFLQRSQVPLEVFVKYITSNETRLRNCYAETIDLNSEDFVKMMLTDAAFVIMFVLSCSAQNQVDSIFNSPMKTRCVEYDLCLLENQLPFFFLDELLELSKVADIAMTQLTGMFLQTVWSQWVREDLPEEIYSSRILHFVDLLGICLKPSNRQQPATQCKASFAQSATELQQAGVKFEQSLRGQLLDIEFDKEQGTLKLPQLTIADETEILFRNINAFEQCHGCCFHLIDYIYLIDLLINSPKDVEILVQNGIVVNYLSSNEAVSTLFNSLGKGCSLNPQKLLYSGLIDELDGYSKRRWNRWTTDLKRKYFNTPWSTISFIAAAFLLILTLIQSVCSIIQVIPK